MLNQMRQGRSPASDAEPVVLRQSRTDFGLRICRVMTTEHAFVRGI